MAIPEPGDHGRPIEFGASIEFAAPIEFGARAAPCPQEALMSTPIRFWFDFVSPYSYLASTQIRALAARHGRDLEPVPVLFAAMLGATGSRGPAEIPAKRAYVHRDILRIARGLGVPIEPPATHPFNPLTALRATGCVDDRDARWRFIEALFHATWVTSRRVDQPEVVARTADSIGLDGETLIARSREAGAKATLRRATEEALALRAFGVPTMRVDGELFWGVDSLARLERLLQGDRATTEEHLERWARVTPSAMRQPELAASPSEAGARK